MKMTPGPLGLSLVGKWGGGEAVPRVQLSATSIAEDAEVGDAVGTLSVSNLGALTVSSYAITADPDSKFTIDTDALETAASLDYETATSHSVTIEATLSDASTVSRTFTIAVTDVAVEGPVTDPGVTAINAEGWSVTFTSPPTFDPVGSPQIVVAERDGFDTTGAPTTYDETLILTQRVRQAYPNHASLDASRVAMSDYLYSTDVVTGVTNNSTEVSPAPVAAWGMLARQVVGNSLSVEVLAFHRNARDREEVACVEITATDGTTTITSKVSTSTVSARSTDKRPVVVYAATLDITSLTDNALVTVNAKVYPWIGDSAAVLDSSASSEARGFSPRYYLKNTTLAASPPYAYVSTAGNDGTGVVSTTAATAEATPFLTVLGAINGIHTALNATTGVDGAIIRVGNDGGTPFVLGSTSATRTQKVGCLTITRDPNVARANARVSWGTASFRPRLGGSLTSPVATGALRFHDIDIVRTGTSAFTGEAAAQLELLFDDVAIDNASQTTTYLANAHDYHSGTVFTNVTGNSVLGATTLEHRMLRGITVNPGGSNIEGWLVVGSDITQPGQLNRGTRSQSGGIVAYNYISKLPTTIHLVSPGSDADVVGYALIQNILEFTSATSYLSFGVSADSATGNNTHVILHHNTVTGFNDQGRSNLFYDEGATARTSKLMSCKGNIHCQINNKGDVFVTDGARVGNWAYLYGAGCQGEFSMFRDAGSGSFAQAYPGPEASLGTSASVRNDPLFTDYEGTTSGPTLGAGGGDYSISGSSPCKNRLTAPVLRFDFAGTTRGSAATASGAYEAP